MDFVLQDIKILAEGDLVSSDLLVSDDKIAAVGKDISLLHPAKVLNFENCVLFPGFTDVHVHLREPGFSYKETVASGSMAAAAGGYVNICTMPNLNPCPDSRENLDIQLDLIKNSAVVNVYPYGSITKNEEGEQLSDMESLAKNVIAFSDDGRGVQSADMMKSAMIKAKTLDKIIVAHCEVNELLNGGYIHDGKYCKEHSHLGICSASEYEQIARDVKLAEETGCSYHICHVSAKESVEIIRQAKKRGVDVTCETAPHYLVLDDSDLKESGSFKMNPPLRDKTDRQALIEGIKDGTVDIIATDHAPHSAEEKSKGLEKSLMGIVGLETAFPILYTKLVKNNVITLDKLIELIHKNPMNRFKIGTPIEVGQPATFTVFDLTEKYIINPQNFVSKGRSTPFENEEVYGRCKLTVINGKIIWEDK